jgi:carbonic anhydrase/acetyltransferase-like protein (isoleucine patch superfamily)
VDIDEFDDLLRAAHLRREQLLREQFERSLPFGDGFGDRWERARRLGFGPEASIYDSSVVIGDVFVGAHTWVGPFTVLDGSGGGLRIGEYCSISSGVHIYTHDTVRWALSRGAEERRTAPVAVGDACYIGSQSVVAAGVTIGTQCVVGANSFVDKAVPDRTVVAGTPARPIGRVEGDGSDVRVLFD